MAYITLSDLKAYGDWPSSDDDALLSDCITRAQQAIETYTGRKFESSSDDEATRYFDSVEDVDGYEIWLDDDLLEVVSITVGTDTIPSSDYVPMPRNRKPYYALKLKSTSSYDWSDYDDDSEDNIVIAAQWAYSSDAPADIVQACLRLAKYFYHSANSTQEADRTIVLDGVTISPTNLPSDVVTLLLPYRKVVI